MSKIRNILFICSGNTCRSPLAEGLLNYYIERSGVLDASKFKVHSAGTLSLPPTPAAEYSQIVASEYGADISKHRCRHLTREIAEEADLILAMAQKHIDYIEDCFPDLKERATLLDRNSDGLTKDIPDPIGYSLDYYREIGKLIDDKIRCLLSDLEREV